MMITYSKTIRSFCISRKGKAFCNQILKVLSSWNTVLIKSNRNRWWASLKRYLITRKGISNIKGKILKCQKRLRLFWIRWWSSRLWSKILILTVNYSKAHPLGLSEFPFWFSLAFEFEWWQFPEYFEVWCLLFFVNPHGNFQVKIYIMANCFQKRNLNSWQFLLFFIIHRLVENSRIVVFLWDFLGAYKLYRVQIIFRATCNIFSSIFLNFISKIQTGLN